MPQSYARADGRGILLAVLAAAFYAISAPLSKLLLSVMPETLMAGFLYLGAGLCMVFVALGKRLMRARRGRLSHRFPATAPAEGRLSRRDLPYTVAMILLDIAAPICLLIGLKSTSAASASLLNNFEIVATAVIALAVFREPISPRLWGGIAFVTLSCAMLSLDDLTDLRVTPGSLFILLAAVLWGFENNCTRKISAKDPMQIVLLKGIFSGLGSILIGLAVGERLHALWSIPATLAVGAVAYGMSIFLYIYAQRLLGAARTSAYYAVAPFIGTLLSLAVFREIPGLTYFIGLALMVVGAYLASSDQPLFRHKG